MPRNENPLYHRWKAMRRRCNNTNTSDYSYYGGRGITVCERWDNFDLFEQDMSATFRPDLTLDRIDPNGNYEPSNCRWLTRKEQSSNRRSNVLLTLDGKTQTIDKWANEMGIDRDVMYKRHRRGWGIEDTIKKPLMKIYG